MGSSYQQNNYKNNNNRNGSKQKQRVRTHELTDGNLVDQAEIVIQNLEKNNRNAPYLSTSKIRNILSMVSELRREALHMSEDKLDEQMKGRAQYLRMRIAYEYGRDDNRRENYPVKDFIDKGELIEEIKGIGDSKEKLLRFCNYMEALTAYHKYYGGKEN